jgi:D-glycero-alpha-D-manno-heptose 1-phosphate guanylyltransferase
MIDTAVILAGGLGTRLRSVVPSLPKPMAPIGGRPFLEILMEYWISQGIKHFVLSVGYRHGLIQDYFGKTFKGAAIDYVVEESPLGTAGGFLLALESFNFKAPILLLNGDTYFEVSLKALDEFANNSEADLCFSLFKTNESGRYMGINIDETSGRLKSFSSEIIEEFVLANGGVYWINPNSCSEIIFSESNPLSLEADIFPYLLHQKKMYGLSFESLFIDIGLPSDYVRAQTLLSNKGGECKLSVD